jgi:hypothetical protein
LISKPEALYQLHPLIPYLKVTSNQAYLLQRLQQLANDSSLQQFIDDQQPSHFASALIGGERIDGKDILVEKVIIMHENR